MESVTQIRVTWALRKQGVALKVDPTAGDGWEKLCSFLGHSIPAEVFPRSNKRYYGLMKVVAKAYVAVKEK